MLLSVSSCLGLSIKQANKTLKKQYADNMEISATLNQKKMSRESISLETLEKYAENDNVKTFYKTASVYFSAGDSIEPLDVAGSFQKNKDFKEEFGDVKNGEKRTTQSEESTTSSSSTATGTSFDGSSGSVVLLSETSTITGSSQESNTNNESQTETSSGNVQSSEQKGSEQENNESKVDERDNNTQSQPEKPSNEKGNSEDTSSKPSDGQNTNPDKPNFENKTDGNTSGTTSGNKPSIGGNSGSNSGSGKPSGDSGGNMPSGGGMPQMGGDTFITNEFFFNMASMNDFTLTGYDSESAMPEYVSELSAITFDTADYKCVISKNLADENELEVGKTFTLKNPENEDESYKFTIVGICDTSKSSDSTDSSSNASFTDNYIYVNSNTIDDILTKSSKKNGTTKVDDDDEKLVALSATYSGKYIFANLNDYNEFSESVDDDITVVSEDVSNYEESISQLETLGQYATYFLIVIFVIGAFVLVIINLFSIRNRKYEIGVLTAIGMKKYKVAIQFIVELFAVTFVALIIGSTVGAVTSVPVTNKLLVAVNSTEESAEKTGSSSDKQTATSPSGNSDSEKPDGMPGNFSKNFKFGNMTKNYVASITSATNVTVIFQMVGIGILLTIVSGLSAMLFIMRYEPLKILNNRD